MSLLQPVALDWRHQQAQRIRVTSVASMPNCTALLGLPTDPLHVDRYFVASVPAIPLQPVAPAKP